MGKQSRSLRYVPHVPSTSIVLHVSRISCVAVRLLCACAVLDRRSTDAETSLSLFANAFFAFMCAMQTRAGAVLRGGAITVGREATMVRTDG